MVMVASSRDAFVGVLDKANCGRGKVVAVTREGDEDRYDLTLVEVSSETPGFIKTLKTLTGVAPGEHLSAAIDNFTRSSDCRGAPVLLRRHNGAGKQLRCQWVLTDNTLNPVLVDGLPVTGAYNRI